MMWELPLEKNPGGFRGARSRFPSSSPARSLSVHPAAGAASPGVWNTGIIEPGNSQEGKKLIRSTLKVGKGFIRRAWKGGLGGTCWPGHPLFLVFIPEFSLRGRLGNKILK